MSALTPEYQRKWREEHPGKDQEYHKTYRQKHHARILANERAGDLRAKLAALSNYGKDGKLMCCWPDCGVTDIDLLTLDHVNNDGAHHRENDDRAVGNKLYRLVRRENFPPGYQTLCWNHQWKKELLRVRGSK
jgi:hypothetical protein